MTNQQKQRTSLSVGYGCANTKHEKIMALRGAVTAERGSRDRRSDVIAKVFRSRAVLRLN